MTDTDIEPLAHVLHENECTALFDDRGDIQDAPGGVLGLYCAGVRCLSRLALSVGGASPLGVGSSLKESHTLLVFQLTHPDLQPTEGPLLTRGTLHLFRTAFLWQGACHVHVRVRHHGPAPVRLDLALHFEADFAGLEAAGSGGRVQRLPAECLVGQVRWSARGARGGEGRTRITLKPVPGQLSHDQARWTVPLVPQGEFHLYAEVRAEVDAGAPAGAVSAPPLDYDTAYRASARARAAWRENRPDIDVSDARIQHWLAASLADVSLLHTAGPQAAAYGPLRPARALHEALLTARLLLWLDPSFARDALMSAPAAPAGALVAPRLIALAGAYFRRTGDLAILRALWPRLRAALRWIDESRDARGFVTRAVADPPRSCPGFFYADGRLAEGPLALGEVQAQVVEAWLHASDLAGVMGDSALSARLRAQAREGRQSFQHGFWLEDAGCFAPALDGRGQACGAIGVHAAHALEAGLATPAQAARMAARLLEPDVYTGFGLRSLASGQAGFNPLSAHHGAVWPQDTARVAIGLARHGHTEAVLALFKGLADAADSWRLQRLPQMFAGFTRREGEGPARQPGACWPHAGASSAALGLLQACLGLDIDALRRRVTLRGPCLPDTLEWLHLRGLRVGAVGLDLRFERAASSVGVQVTRQVGEGEVQVCVQARTTRGGT